MKRKKGFFSISAVAKMFSVHQQTIRLYEKEGLITPKRSTGNTRLFSEEDVDKLEQVIYLTHELGINLAGVEMVLRLQKQIKKMQKEINKAFQETNDQLDKENTLFKEQAQERAQRLLDMKKEKTVTTEVKRYQQPKKPTPEETQPIDLTQWEISYDE
jgi:MerR family transcriptional regulator, heat shock protein HspR